MLFGLMRRAEPLRDVFQRERGLVVVELIDEALGYEEISAAIASDGDLSTSELRDSALAASEQILRAAASEENSLLDILKQTGNSYDKKHWDVPGWLSDLSSLAAVIVFLGAPIISAIATWYLVDDLTGSKLWASVLAVLAGGFIGGAYWISDKDIFPEYLDWPMLSLFALSSGYVEFVATDSRGPFSWAVATACAIAAFMITIFATANLESKEQLGDREGVRRYVPSPSTAPVYDSWRRALREAGILSFLRERINITLLTRYSTVLSVEAAPGLRHLGDLKYHVPTVARDDLIQRVNQVDGGSFALAGPRGAGKTILMRAFCDGRFAADPARDLGIVVSAPVDYEPRDFVLYLYAEVCKKTKEYVERLTPSKVLDTKKAWAIASRVRLLLPFPQRDTSRPPSALGDLSRLAERKLRQARYLQTFSTELSGKFGVPAAELTTKAATSLAEQPLTYPEIVADLREFLENIANALRTATSVSTKMLPRDESPPRVLIGIDELDRIGSGERARRFLDDIKAIFWVSGCYFLISVSEDALRAFELAGQGMRDVFDSAFDEIIRVEHLDFDASSHLLRARVTGLSTPYHALAYCLSGGLPRELMRAARAITNQQLSNAEVRLGQVTAKIVTDEFQRHSHAARLALVNIENADTTYRLIHLLNSGCRPTHNDLCKFSEAATAATADSPASVRSLAETVAAHAYYLSALCAVFNDQLRQEDVERATDETQPDEIRFDALARARRYLGVNDSFARTLVDGFLKAQV